MTDMMMTHEREKETLWRLGCHHVNVCRGVRVGEHTKEWQRLPRLPFNIDVTSRLRAPR
jgi:hypothetical protein